MTPAVSIPEGRMGSGPVSSKWFAPAVTDRALRLITPVEAGEGTGALLLTLNVLLLLTAYYILKTVREALILSDGGAEAKAYASAGQAVLLLALIPAYGWLAGRLTRFRLVAAVMLFFLCNLPVFYVLNRLGVPIGIPFYLWLGVRHCPSHRSHPQFASNRSRGTRCFKCACRSFETSGLSPDRQALRPVYVQKDSEQSREEVTQL